MHFLALYIQFSNIILFQKLIRNMTDAGFNFFFVLWGTYNYLLTSLLTTKYSAVFNQMIVINTKITGISRLLKCFFQEQGKALISSIQKQYLFSKLNSVISSQHFIFQRFLKVFLIKN